MSVVEINEALERGPVKWLGVFLSSVSSMVLMLLVILTSVDVVGRYLFNKPLTGATEVTEVFIAAVVFSALPIVCWRSDQVVVDIFDSFFSPIVDFIRNVLINLLMAVALFVVGKKIFALAERSIRSGEISEHLNFPVGWVMNFVGVMCWVSAIALITIGVYRAWLVLKLDSSASRGGL